MSRDMIYGQIEEMFGFVPSFFRTIPDTSLELEWRLFRQAQFEEGAIPNLYRELIGLAISSATRCRYCLHYHTEVSKLYGATEEQLEATVRWTKTCAGWGSYVNGLQPDFEEFKSEIHQASEHIRGVLSKGLKPMDVETELKWTRDEVYRDMEEVFGLVPGFFKRVPDRRLATEWLVVKRELFGEGPIPIKYRHLIGVGLGAALRCRFTVFFHTELAKLCGATDEEIEDAISYAKSNMSWSAYITGLQTDFERFKAEVHRACKHVMKVHGRELRHAEMMSR